MKYLYLFILVFLTGCGHFKLQSELNKFPTLKEANHNIVHIYSCGTTALENFNYDEVYISNHILSNKSIVRNVLSLFFFDANGIIWPKEMESFFEYHNITYFKYTKNLDRVISELKSEKNIEGIALLKLENLFKYHWIYFRNIDLKMYKEADFKIVIIYANHNLHH